MRSPYGRLKQRPFQYLENNNAGEGGDGNGKNPVHNNFTQHSEINSLKSSCQSHTGNGADRRMTKLDGVIVKKIAPSYSPNVLDRLEMLRMIWGRYSTGTSCLCPPALDASRW